MACCVRCRIAQSRTQHAARCLIAAGQLFAATVRFRLSLFTRLTSYKAMPQLWSRHTGVKACNAQMSRLFVRAIWAQLRNAQLPEHNWAGRSFARNKGAPALSPKGSAPMMEQRNWRCARCSTMRLSRARLISRPRRLPILSPLPAFRLKHWSRNRLWMKAIAAIWAAIMQRQQPISRRCKNGSRMKERARKIAVNF